MVTVFNTPADDVMIRNAREKVGGMSINGKNNYYIRLKANQDMLVFINVLIPLLALYLSNNKIATQACGFILLVIYIVFEIPYRRKNSIEINVIENINNFEMRDGKNYR